MQTYTHRTLGHRADKFSSVGLNVAGLRLSDMGTLSKQGLTVGKMKRLIEEHSGISADVMYFVREAKGEESAEKMSDDANFCTAVGISDNCDITTVQLTLKMRNWIQVIVFLQTDFSIIIFVPLLPLYMCSFVCHTVVGLT